MVSAGVFMDEGSRPGERCQPASRYRLEFEDEPECVARDGISLTEPVMEVLRCA